MTDKCTHPKKWACDYQDDRDGCQAQAIYDAFMAPDPTLGVERPLSHKIAMGKVELTTSQGPTESFTYDTETGKRAEHTAIPDGFDEYAGGRSVYRSGFLGAKHVDHVKEGDDE